MSIHDSGYISSYVADPFTTGGVTSSAMKTGKMNFVLTDVNEVEYPESVLPSQKYDEEVKNIVNYGEVGEDIWFAFEYHVKGVWAIDHKILGKYNA